MTDRRNPDHHRLVMEHADDAVALLDEQDATIERLTQRGADAEERAHEMSLRYDRLTLDYAKKCARLAECERAINAHNESCQDLCGRGDQEAVRCKYRPYFVGSGRRCPDCPTHWKIEYPAMGDGT